MPARNKHLILVHGRSTKPSRDEKTRLVREVLEHGVSRASKSAAKALRNDKVRFSLAYYGDINNRILRERKHSSMRWLVATDPAFDNAPCEAPGSYDDNIAAILRRGPRDFTKRAYERWLGEVKSAPYIDDVASLASSIANVLGLSERFVRNFSPDMSAYLTTRRAGSDIRRRLQTPLREALLAGDDVCLVAHSMGCIVAYDVLWKFSRMSEYEDLHGKPVTRWITMGSPLGEPGVQGCLYDADERSDGRYPDNAALAWINFAAHDDFVAHDERIADDFADMRTRGLIRRIVDRPKIYNFYEGTQGGNPHKLYAYLNHPKVGAEIANWILAPSARG